MTTFEIFAIALLACGNGETYFVGSKKIPGRQTRCFVAMSECLEKSKTKEGQKKCISDPEKYWLPENFK